MPGSALQNLGLISGWNSGENGWGASYNSNMRRLDALVQGYVLSRGLSAPPASPQIGDCHIIGGSPTGAWSGQTNNISRWNGVAYEFFVPKDGWRLYVLDEDQDVRFSSGSWASVATALEVFIDGVVAESQSVLNLVPGAGVSLVDAGGGNIVVSATGAGSVPSNVLSVSSVSSLRTLGAPSESTKVLLDGYYARGDGGGGILHWDNSSTADDDGVLVFMPSSAPASGRWIRQWHGVLSIRQAGATGDGLDDDSPRISAALVALGSGGGGVLLFPAGVYLIGSSVVISANNIDIKGERGAILKRTAAIEIFVVSGDNNLIELLEFDGDKATLPYPANSRHANVLVTGSGNTLHRLKSKNSNSHGICLDGQASTCQYNEVLGCLLSANEEVGIANNKASYGLLQGNIITGSGYEGLTLDNQSDRNRVIGNSLYGNCTNGGVGGLGIDYAQHNTIVGNFVCGTLSGLPGVRTQNNLGTSSHNTFQGNVITGNASYGVHLKANGANYSTYNNLVGNVIQGNNSGGVQVQIDSGCNSNDLRGNSLGGGSISDAGALNSWNGTGTFTPVAKGDSTAGAGTYSVQSGHYAREGRLVYFRLSLAWSAHTGSGGLFVDGFPFEADASADLTPVSGWHSNLGSGGGSLCGLLVCSPSTRIWLDKCTIGSAAANTGVDAAASLHLSGVYIGK